MKYIAILIGLLTLSACGTVSNLQSTNNTAPEGQTNHLDLSSYDYVVVKDFQDGMTESKNDPTITLRGKEFADIIAERVRAENAFTKVLRHDPLSGEKTLLVEGEITDYAEGNSTARLLIGFGAGSSHFDANLKVLDYGTKQPLGDIKVDRMSWLLGGAIAAGQNAYSHMVAAANKIAKELAAAKQNTQSSDKVAVLGAK